MPTNIPETPYHCILTYCSAYSAILTKLQPFFCKQHFLQSNAFFKSKIISYSKLA